MNEKDIRKIKTGYDLATLFRLLPWVFLMGDKRPPQTLAEAAFRDVKTFIDAHVNDDSRSRYALMRGLAINWLQSMGANVDPHAIEVLTGLITQEVDKYVDISRNQLEGEDAES